MNTTIEIPKPFKTRTADILDQSWCAVAEHSGIDYLLTEAQQFALGRRYSTPIVRFLNDYQILVVDCRAKSIKDLNATIFDLGGNVVGNFHVGDMIRDVTITKRTIAIGFADEGVLGDNPISNSGVAIFDLKGKFLHGYNSAATAGIFVMDCYCLCSAGGDEIAFVSYPTMQLIHWNAKTKHHSATTLPKIARGPCAIAIHQSKLYVIGSYHDKNTMLRIEDGSISALQIPRTTPTILRDGRFLLQSRNNLTVIDPEDLAKLPS